MHSDLEGLREVMMKLLRWTFSPLIAVSAALAVTPSGAAEIRDHAGMFSADAVRKAEQTLSKAERASGIPIMIETIEAVPGLEAGAASADKLQAVNELAEKRGRDINVEGIYMLLSKKDRVLSKILVRRQYANAISRKDQEAVRDAFVAPFKAGDYDGGLAKASETLASALPDGPAAVPGHRRAADAGPVAPAGARRGQPHGIGSLLAIGLGILGVLFVVRLLGGLFGGRGVGGAYPPQMGGMQRPGMGPGFGGPGYGGGYGYGRGGGFFSSLMGGIGGAMAGNWLYDQFSGRSHGHGHADASNYNSDFGNAADPGGDDPGGGFWSNSDTGGGGDWGGDGGGGGDWGGGGGDWGGGDDGGSW
jgi:uncharacterized protein